MGTLSFTLSKEVSKNTDKASLSAGKISPTFNFKDFNDKSTTLNDFKRKICLCRYMGNLV